MKIKHPAVLCDMIRINEIKEGKYDECAKVMLLKNTDLNYKPRALAKLNIGIGGTGIGHEELKNDSKQVYGQALAYIITGNDIYAKNSMKIIDSWSSKNMEFIGSNAPLEAAWCTAAMARGCELLKWCYNGWDKNVEAKYKLWVNDILMPHLTGMTEKYKLNWGFYNNWHTSITEARLQFALLCEDTDEVNNMIDKYKIIFNSYVKSNGLTGESFRDSDHCCFGLAGMIQICELCYHQGVDLYSLRDNLLLKCIELHAGIYNGKENNLYDIKLFNIYKWVQPSGWEIAFNHYVKRKNEKMPNTLCLLQKIRPCKYELHWGYDTLTHCK
jgi:hypothetical protein